MTLSAVIKTEMPIDETKTERMLDTIGAHYTAEITAIKLQRPTPTPALVVPKTPIGQNLETVLKQLDSVVKEEYPELDDNPWRDTEFPGWHILNGYNETYEANLQGLILYYNTPNPAPPPAGYPTTPIPKPIVIPGPTTIPLTPTAIQNHIMGKLKKDLPASATPQTESFARGWGKHLLTEVFI